MEEINNQQVTDVQTSATEQKTDVVSENKSQGGDSQSDITQTTEAQPYTPNYKYKSYDSEFEFDEFVKPLVTNKQVEEKLRELYAAQKGIEGVSKARDKAQSEFQEYKKQWNPVVDIVQKANKAYQNKDYDLFFKTLGVPENEVLKYAYKRLEYMDMPQDKRAQVDQDVDFKRNYYQTKEEADLLKEQFLDLQKQKTLSEIDNALSNQEVSALVKLFDERNGQGSFKEEVINRGVYLYQTTGKNLSPQEVVKDLVNKYGFALNPQQVNTQSTPQATSQVVQRKDVPVMPTAKGGSSSVAGKSIKSLDDIHAIRKEKYGY